MSMQPPYDHTRSKWAVAALGWLEEAVLAVTGGTDALPAVTAAHACLRIEVGEQAEDPDLLRPCSHEFELGGVAYACERLPHPVNGYGPEFRHAAAIDEGHAEHTDSGDGEASLMTWGEDGNGDGQDWEIAWGTLAGYGAEGGDPS